MALQLLPKRQPRERVLLDIKPGAEEQLPTEGDLRPETQHDIAGTCFAPILGLKIVDSVKTDFFHHGWHVVDEPCAGMTRPVHHDGHPHLVEERIGARIPDEVVPGETPVDTASYSLIPPDISRLHLSEAERSWDDLRHITRGGPQAASR